MRCYFNTTPTTFRSLCLSVSCWMKSSYKLDEIGSSQLILLLQAPKPNCFLSPIPWIQNSNYHVFLHWKINTKAQLATEMKSSFFGHKNKLNFCSHGLKNGARNARKKYNSLKSETECIHHLGKRGLSFKQFHTKYFTEKLLCVQFPFILAW